MSMTINKELPNPAALKAQFPLPEDIRRIKAQRDAEIAKVFRGKSDKFLVIVGPCSADNEDAVCEYTQRLARVKAGAIQHRLDLGERKAQLPQQQNRLQPFKRRVVIEPVSGLGELRGLQNADRVIVV